MFFQRWKRKADEEFWVEEAPALGYENTSFPFAVLASALIASVVVAGAERILEAK